jgi:hypothetical protein
MSRNALALVVDRGKIVVTLPGQVDDLHGLTLLIGEILKERGGTEEQLIDACGPLASTHDKQCGTRRIKSEYGAGRSFVQRDAEILADRCSRHDAGALGEGGLAVSQSQQDAIGPA